MRISQNGRRHSSPGRRASNDASPEPYHPPARETFDNATHINVLTDELFQYIMLFNLFLKSFTKS